MSDNVGLEGAPGNVDGSGVRWKMMEGLEGASTISAALHDVSPVSLTALHVYIAVSVSRRPTNNRTLIIHLYLIQCRIFHSAYMVDGLA